MMVKQLPPEIHPMPETPSDSESVISNTEDEIISAEERMNVVRRNDNIGHSVEKQQLKTDLNIANRQIQVSCVIYKSSVL